MKSKKPTVDIGICDGPGLIELSVSKAKVWRRCQTKYGYKYDWKLKPRGKVRPLTLGSLVHECIEARASGKNWVQQIRDFKSGEWSKLFEDERVLLGDIPQDAYRIMRGYHYYYLESDKRFRSIGAEVPFRVRIGDSPVVLVGIIDEIKEEIATGEIWGYEHKTVKKDLPSEDFRSTDFQTAIYTFVMKLLLPILGYDPKRFRGFVLDYLRTSPPTMPEILKNGTLSKRKITCDYYTYLECIKSINGNPEDYQDILEYMKTNVFYKRIPIVKSEYLTGMFVNEMVRVAQQIKMCSGMYTRALDWTCDRPKCEYRDLCIAEIQGFDIQQLIKLNFDTKEEEETKDGEGESE
jgi:hypothetical protein